MSKKDSLAVEQIIEDNSSSEPTVRVFIPLAEGDGSTKVDQTEVVIVNGETTMIKRGEYVDVKIPVFMQLRNKYPNI